MIAQSLTALIDAGTVEPQDIDYIAHRFVWLLNSFKDELEIREKAHEQ